MAENPESHNEQLGPKSGPYSTETTGLAQGPGGTVSPACAPPQGQQWCRLPAGLRERRQWCLAGPDKAPMFVGADGEPCHASVTTPVQWLDFETVCREAEALGLGIGYVLTADDPFTCIDLDVKDAATPEQLDLHERIVTGFDSYTELSRSGKGRHVWVFGNIGKGVRRDGVEVYSQERFIICTGNVALNRPIQEGGEKLTNMVGQMRALEAGDVELRLEQPGDDSGAFLALYAIENEGELGRLMKGDWEGRHYRSHSEADFALMKELARLSESNGACRGAFRLSGLSKREDKPNKYTDKHLNMTLRNARGQLALETAQIEHGRQIAEGLFWRSPVPHNGRHFRLVSDDDMQRLPAPRWLVKGIIPEASIGTIYGQSGTFKSFLALDLLAHISNGQPWFGCRVKAAPAVYVPFEGQGGIPKRIAAWRAARVHQGQVNVRTNMRFITEPMNLREQADRDKLVATLTENGWAGGVLCIDTLAQAGPGIDENASQGMGEMIAIFQELQRRLGGVVLVVHHSGKDERAGMRGWSGLRGALDFVIKCWRDEAWSPLQAQFVLDKVKDDKEGTHFDFKMLIVTLSHDEDGDFVSSLAVMPSTDREAEPPPDDAQTAIVDDDFVENWIRKEVANGRQPTGRWLDAQRVHVKAERDLTQKRLRDAVDRLKGAGRLVEAGTGRGQWLRPVDSNPHGAVR